MSEQLFQASHQWYTRPADERYLSLTEMQTHFEETRKLSAEATLSSVKLEIEPLQDNQGLVVGAASTGALYAPTNWAFGQLAQLARAPAGYLRQLPSPIVADCLNYGLKFTRQIEDVKLLTYQNGSPILRAATGPNYGRIWNNDVLRALVEEFGNGISGKFRVPGEFGVKVDVTKQNTTLYASDRNFFVFLADEENRIEIPNRRDGQSGALARGFFVWNSEEGDKTFGIKTFLFDYACMNRIVWGAEDVKQITIRHTVSAPDKFIHEIRPALEAYANSSASSITVAIEAARKKRLDVDVRDFLSKRFGFGVKATDLIVNRHQQEEGRPIETLWDVATGITAYARDIPNQDDRVAVESKAGDALNLAIV